MHEKGVSAERLVFTTLHAGGKFDNSAYKTSGGAGLGLAIAREIIELHQGEIKADMEGTTITFTLRLPYEQKVIL